MLYLRFGIFLLSPFESTIELTPLKKNLYDFFLDFYLLNETFNYELKNCFVKIWQSVFYTRVPVQDARKFTKKTIIPYMGKV